jgi:hypothetical protein
MEQMKSWAVNTCWAPRGGSTAGAGAQVLEEAAVRLDTPLVPLPPCGRIGLPRKVGAGDSLWERGHTGTFIFHTGQSSPSGGGARFSVMGGWAAD